MAACANGHLEELVAQRFRKYEWHFFQTFSICTLLGAVLWVWTIPLVAMEILNPSWLIGATGLASVLVWHGYQVRLASRCIRGQKTIAYFLDQDDDPHWNLSYPGVCCETCQGGADAVLVIDLAGGRQHSITSLELGRWTVTDIWASHQKGLRICLEDQRDQPIPALPLAEALELLRFQTATTFCYQAVEALKRLRLLKRSEKRLRGMRNEALALLTAVYDLETKGADEKRRTAVCRRLVHFLDRAMNDATVPESFRTWWVLTVARQAGAGKPSL